ncbi:MAG: peptide ABC transporter substrate-binding protein [Trueperaceae bacterium]|nr:peptide ABC transporter substrate-binding protein [Trueperaceae bacterium]
MRNARRSLARLLVASVLTVAPMAAAQTLTILFPQEPGSLFPHFDLLSLAHEAQDLLFDRLFAVDEQGAYLPVLAAEVPTVANGGISADGRVYTIRLREGPTWHDGTPVTSADLAFTWRVITDPNLPIPTRTVWQDIVSIDTPDARTAVVTFGDTNVSFLGAASFAGAFLLPSHLLQDVDDLANAPFHRAPVGNGAFRLVEWQAGSFLRFERHDAYWDGAAHFEAVVIRIVPGSEAQRTVLSRGEADLVLQVALTELPFVDGLDAYRRISVPTFANWQLWLNNEDPVLADARVRRALVHAIDRETIADALLGGLSRPDDAILPVSHWAHADDVSRYPYDAAAAERLLDEAGWVRAGAGRARDGQPLVVELINIAGQADRLQVVQAVQAYWRAVGVQAEIREVDAASFVPTLSGGDFQSAYGFFGEGQEPVWNLWLGTNWQRYGNQEALGLLRAYGVTVEREARRELAVAFQRQVAEDVPVIVLAPRPLLAVVRADLQGYAPTTTSSLWNVHTWNR